MSAVGLGCGRDRRAPADEYRFEGSGDDSNLRHLRATLGVSLFWDSPLGPLRFDLSRPVRKLDSAYDEDQNFDFSIVSTF